MGDGTTIENALIVDMSGRVGIGGVPHSFLPVDTNLYVRANHTRWELGVDGFERGYEIGQIQPGYGGDHADFEIMPVNGNTGIVLGYNDSISGKHGAFFDCCGNTLLGPDIQRSPSGTLHVIGGHDPNNPTTLVLSGKEHANQAIYTGIQFERTGGGLFFGLGADSRVDRDELYYGGGFGSVKTATSHRFFTDASGATTGIERVTIDLSGNVGIGTADYTGIRRRSLAGRIP